MSDKTGPRLVIDDSAATHPHNTPSPSPSPSARNIYPNTATAISNPVELFSLPSIPKVKFYAGKKQILFTLSHGEVGEFSQFIINTAHISGLIKDKSATRAFQCVIYNLIVAVLTEIRTESPEPIWVAVSRNVNAYSKSPHSYGYKKEIGHTAMITALNTLLKAGFLEQVLGYHNSDFEKGVSTTIRATTAFLALLEAYRPSIEIATFREKGQILLRGKDGMMKEFTPTKETKQITADLKLINENNRRSSFAFTPITLSAEAILLPEAFTLEAKFKPNLRRGGRNYCSVQNLHRAERASLTIDGQPTVELDYSGLHPTLCYHLSGMPMIRKAYDIPGISAANRPAIKASLLIVFNVLSRTEAIHAIRSELQSEGIGLFDISLTVLLDAILAAHEPIANVFFSGDGTRLQKIDGQIARAVMVEFARMNKPCLGIHDSFVVRSEDELLLRRTMEECYRRIVSEIAHENYADWVPGIARAHT